MKTDNKSSGRHWYTYLPIISKSLLFTILVLLVWYYYFWDNFKIWPENSEVMSAVVAGFLVFSALLPTFTITRLSTQFDDLTAAVADDDFREFKKIYKRSVHPLTYLAIIVVSLLAILSLMMLPYEKSAVGLFAVGGLAFVHCFFFYITRELDNPNILDLNTPPDWRKKLAAEQPQDDGK